MNPRTEVRPLPDNQLKAVRATFQKLSAQFAQAHPDSPYRDYVGAAASNQAVLERQLNAFKLYAPYITDGSSILDWGCRHAPDSCMVKTVFPNVAIDGCDTMDDDFSNFHEYAGLNFTLLQHVYQLPYADEKFDAVISGGVLEHVAFETESLKEIWRILKKDGLFFITFLPNRTSWSENISRILGSLNGHNRTYDLDDFQKTILRQGFFVETAGYHQIFPTLGKSASRNSFRNLFTMATVPLNRPLEQMPIIRSVASNIYLVARKVDCL